MTNDNGTNDKGMTKSKANPVAKLRRNCVRSAAVLNVFFCRLMCFVQRQVGQNGANLDSNKKFGFAVQTRYHAGFVRVGKGLKRYKVNILDA